MAQVRIDESLIIDPRFKELVDKCMDATSNFLTRLEAEEIAIGKCWRAFHLAQKYWRDDRKLIPISVWKLGSCASFASLMEQCGFADLRPEGVYLSGSKEFFDWYLDKKEAGKLGGINSGKVRKDRAAVQEGSNEPVMLCSSSVLKEEESNKGQNKPEQFTAAQLLDAWNTHRGDLTEIKRLSKARLDKIKVRREEEPNLEYWVACIKRLAASSFATGKVKSANFPSGWKADFDWLIKNDLNHTKVAEGKYDNQGSSKKQPQMKVFTAEDFPQ